MHRLLCAAAALAVLSTAVASANREGDSMRISSPAFADQQPIPRKYTCDGDDVSPPLKFEGVPAAAVSLALVVDDPDAPAGTWDHWVLWNIPADVTEIVEAKAPAATIGRNSWGKNAWGGPCPPAGQHRYFFKVWALDTKLDLAPGARKRDLATAMKGHVVAEGQLVGVYQRQR